MIARMRHTIHLCFKPHHWLIHAASASAAAFIGAFALEWDPWVTRSYLSGFFEVFGSIAVAAGSAHALTVDDDEGAKEVLLTCPTSPLRLALERIAAGFVLSACPLLVLAGVLYALIRARLDPGAVAFISMDTILVDAGGSWIFLGGIALAASAWQASWSAGMFASGFYWLLDLASRGRFTSSLYLFYGTFRPGAESVGLNRFLLVALGSIACAAAAMRFGRGRERR